MLSVLDPLAAGDLAASSTGLGSIQPWLIFVFIAVILVTNFAKAANRRKRTRNSSPYVQTPPRSGPAGIAHQATSVPYVGTLLNGVPMKSYDTVHGHQTTGFANERMIAEAELKRQLDALDTARRAGQVTAEQYAVHREAIFRNF